MLIQPILPQYLATKAASRSAQPGTTWLMAHNTLTHAPGMRYRPTGLMCHVWLKGTGCTSLGETEGSGSGFAPTSTWCIKLACALVARPRNQLSNSVTGLKAQIINNRLSNLFPFSHHSHHLGGRELESAVGSNSQASADQHISWHVAKAS